MDAIIIRVARRSIVAGVYRRNVRWPARGKGGANRHVERPSLRADASGRGRPAPPLRGKTVGAGRCSHGSDFTRLAESGQRGNTIQSARARNRSDSTAAL